MISPENDPREVLQKFVATLNVSVDAVVPAAVNLAHPKGHQVRPGYCIKTMRASIRG